MAFIKHIPCEKCGSSDAGALYTDGGTSCHSCGAGRINAEYDNLTELGSFEDDVAPFQDSSLYTGEAKALRSRGIPEEVCKKYHYLVGNKDNGETIQIANYYDTQSKKLTGQKVRTANKSFSVKGTTKGVGLFGQQCFGAGSAKAVVITEGELDALSVAVAYD